MNRNDFLERYPEFDTATTPLIDSTLAEAEGAIDAVVFGTRFDEAHGALTAHKLWSSPFGVTLRLDGDSGASSKYLEHFNRVKKAVTVPLTMLVL